MSKVNHIIFKLFVDLFRVTKLIDRMVSHDQSTLLPYRANFTFILEQELTAEVESKPLDEARNTVMATTP